MQVVYSKVEVSVLANFQLKEGNKTWEYLLLINYQMLNIFFYMLHVCDGKTLLNVYHLSLMCALTTEH